MNRWLGRVAVVTGASSGIGREAAIKLATNGIKVAGLARRTDRLEELSASLNAERKEKVFHTVKCDVSKEEDILKSFDWIGKTLGPPSVLINNAGYGGSLSPLLDTDAENINRIFQTNVTGLTLCGKAAIRSMLSNGIDDGYIVNINSIVGHIILQTDLATGLTIYTASKHAVTVLTDGFRKELHKKGSNIKVTSLSPGFVKTDLADSLEVPSFLPDVVPLEASDIADTIITLLQTPPNVLITECTILPVSQA